MLTEQDEALMLYYLEQLDNDEELTEEELEILNEKIRALKEAYNKENAILDNQIKMLEARREELERKNSFLDQALLDAAGALTQAKAKFMEVFNNSKNSIPSTPRRFFK